MGRGLQSGREKGEKKWDNCNSIINKINFKNIDRISQFDCETNVTSCIYVDNRNSVLAFMNDDEVYSHLLNVVVNSGMFGHVMTSEHNFPIGSNSVRIAISTGSL